MKQLLIAAVWLAISPVAFAQAYGSGSVDRLHSLFDCPGTLICSSTGFKAKLGYELTPRFAAEMVYIDLHKASTSLLMNLPSHNRGNSVGFHVLGTLPLASAWSGFARVGLNRTSVDIYGWMSNRTDRSNTASIGMGVHYAIQDNVLVRGGIERYWLDTADERHNITNVSVGLKYRF